ncbi:uncharacterized protein IL334_004409 [Kwoniella shivajii]|uniref:Uncharacterized protein n=1 Tax=Kwoniella shivajii TaxID=564305 RepID=A0ABZ1D0U2_9TREE|nr:hypothetical protein IL334_004409 [Kwoniella shivajii]
MIKSRLPPLTGIGSPSNESASATGSSKAYTDFRETCKNLMNERGLWACKFDHIEPFSGDGEAEMNQSWEAAKTASQAWHDTIRSGTNIKPGATVNHIEAFEWFTRESNEIEPSKEFMSTMISIAPSFFTIDDAQ